MKPDVLSIGTFPDATMAELANRFTVHHFPRIGHALEGLKPDIGARIRALGTEANQGISAALLAKLPKLEVVSVFGVGLDLVDRAALKTRNIPVSNTPGLVAVEVADLAIGMMLASARQIIYADHYVREGHWRQAQIALGRSVGKKTLGVVGLGAIGRADRRPRRGVQHACHLPGPAPASRTRPTTTSPTSSNSRGRAISSWSPARAGRRRAIWFRRR